MLSKDLIELIQQIRKNGSEDNRIEIKKLPEDVQRFMTHSQVFPINPEEALLYSV